MNRKYLALLFACVLGLIQISCGGKSGKSSSDAESNEHAEFVSGLTSEDTVQIVKICNDCMNTLKEGRVDDALKMMYSLTAEGELQPLSAEKEAQLRKNFKFFPVLDYKMDYFSFNTSGINDVKYTIEFFEKPEGDITPNTINFMFNPVKKDGTWYITVKEAGQSFDENKY